AKTPWADPNQAYAAHAANWVIMRESGEGSAAAPIVTWRLPVLSVNVLSWCAAVNEQAIGVLDFQLSANDVFNIRLISTDEYGNFIRGAAGYPQLVVDLGADGQLGTADDVLVEGNPGAPISPAAVGAFRTGHAFIDDIAHNAVPGTTYLVNGVPTVVAADTDDAAGNAIGTDARGNKTAYDNEMLDAH